MAKKSVSQFAEPSGFDFQRTYFSPTDVDNIAKAAQLDRHDNALKLALEAQAQWYFGWYKPNETRPTDKQLQNALKTVEKAAGKLLTQLHLGADQVPYALRTHLQAGADAEAQTLRLQSEARIRNSHRRAQGKLELHRSGHDLLREAIEGIYRLRVWAAAPQPANQTAADNTSKRHPGDEALNELILGLVEEVWKGLLSQPATLTYDATKSRKGAQAETPVVKFVSAVLNKLEINDKDGDAFTYDAIRTRIQRLPI